jgi:hypothetical protein
MKTIIGIIDRFRWAIAFLAFLAAMILLNGCAPLPIRRDTVQEFAPVPVHVIRNIQDSRFKIQEP